jgi:hypothetical protein
VARADYLAAVFAVNSMARPRSYHQDRALTGAERARAFRERRKQRNETSHRPHRSETPDRNETGVTKSRNETADRNETRVTKLSAVAPTAVGPSPTVRYPAGRAGDVPSKVWARLKQLGKPPTDRMTVIQIIREIYGDDGKEAALKAYDRAVPRRVVAERMPMARRWGERQIDAAPYEAHDAVRELIELFNG